MNGLPSSATPKHYSSHSILLKLLSVVLLLGLSLLHITAAHAQVAYRSAATASTNSASSLSISKPLGTVANDVLIASIAVRPNTISISVPGSSSITRVGVGATVGANSGSVTATLPTGIAIGDLMLCLVESHDNVSHSTSTSEWTKLYEISTPSTHHASLFWKVATSISEPNPVISHNGGSSIVTQCVAYRGVNTTTPFDTTPAYAVNSSNANNATSVSTGTLTTVTNGVKLLFAAHVADNPSSLVITTGAGLSWSQAFLGTHNQRGDIDAAVGLFDADQATAGSTGAFTASYNQPDISHGVLLALRPASVGGVGWALIRTDTATSGNMGTLASYYKVAGASEPSSYTFTFSGATTGAVGSILAFSGVDTTTPIDQQNGQTTPNSVNHTAPGVTTTSSGDMLITAHAYASSRTWTPAFPMTERVDIASTTGAGGIALEVNTEPQATAGATGTRTATAAGDSDTGAAHFLALRPNIFPIAEYHFDEAAWNGTANEVTDTSGNLYSGTAASLSATKPTTSDTSPVISGNPGTCRYGVFNRTNKDYVALPTAFPNLGANGNAFTITAWIKTTDNTQSGQRIFIDDENNTGGFGISLGDGGTGRVRFYSRGTPSQLILDTANVITNNTWYFVAAVADIPNKTKRIYVYNTAGTKLAEVSATWTETSFGSDSGIASIGGETNAAGEKTSSFGFSGSIDEVSVFGNALSQSSIESIRARTHSCGATTVDHFVISHSGTGVNCQAEPVTFTAHNATHTVVTIPAGTVIDITTSTTHGDWTLVSGGGTLTNNGNGSARYIAGIESGFTLNLKDTFPETTNINMVSSISVTERSGTASADTPFDPSIVFSPSGFRFLDTANNETIATQIGGKTSTTYYLQAIRTDTRTGTCVGAFAAGQTANLDLAFQCNNPTTSAGRQVAFTNNAITTNLTANPSTGITTYTTAIPVTFLNDSTSRAAFTINYPDVGQITLAARHNLPLANGSPSGNLMTGTSNPFVVRPFALAVTAVGNPAANTPAGAVYRIAGNDFTANVHAVLWQSADDADNNGIADGHDDSDPANNANLTDNTAAPNFGKESTAETISLFAALNQPAGGVNPPLAGTTSVSSFTSGGGNTTLRYNEVGIIELRTAIGDGNYLGIGALSTSQIVGRSGFVGRFYPDHFIISPGAVTEGCNAGDFTYFGQDGFSTAFTLTAQNTSNATTQNYTGTFAKLGLTAWNNFTFTATGLPAGSVLAASTTTAPTGTWTNGAAAVVATHQTTRPASPVAPADITVNAKPSDTDGTTMPSAFAVQTTTTMLRYGRLRLPNAYGPETELIIMPARLEYYNGTTFALNTLDSCTNPGGITNYRLDNNLEANQVDGTIKINGNASTTLTVGPINAGIINLAFSPPGSGKIGYADVTALITTPLPWLLYEWDGLDNDYNENPSARVNFGIYRGNDRIINWREIIR